MSMTDLADWVLAHDNFLVASHASPDGDAIGSMLGAAHILKALGKKVVMYNASGIPEAYAWLDLPASLLTSLKGEAKSLPPACLMLDCGDLHRAGEELRRAVEGGVFAHTASIDHHRDNPMFADVNWVETEASATAQMVGELAEFLGLTLSGPLGEAVYLGISDDTGNFSYDNTTREILLLAAKIVGQGLHVGEFNNKLNNQWTSERFRARGELFGRVETALNGRVAYVLIDEEFFARHRLPDTDFSEISSLLRRVKGAGIGLLVRFVKAGKSKASLRSSGAVDVCKAAQAFGGGGHRNAAGVEMAAAPREALELLLPQLEIVLNEADKAGGA